MPEIDWAAIADKLTAQNMAREKGLLACYDANELAAIMEGQIIGAAKLGYLQAMGDIGAALRG